MCLLLTSCGVNCVRSWLFSHRSCRVTTTPMTWKCRQKTYQRRRHWWRKTATIRSVSSRLWLVADPDHAGSLSLRLAAEFSQYALAIVNCHLLANNPTNLAMPFAKRRWLANIPPPAGLGWGYLPAPTAFGAQCRTYSSSCLRFSTYTG